MLLSYYTLCLTPSPICRCIRRTVVFCPCRFRRSWGVHTKNVFTYKEGSVGLFKPKMLTYKEGSVGSIILLYYILVYIYKEGSICRVKSSYFIYLYIYVALSPLVAHVHIHTWYSAVSACRCWGV